jgi:hypothetical protein
MKTNICALLMLTMMSPYALAGQEKGGGDVLSSTIMSRIKWYKEFLAEQDHYHGLDDILEDFQLLQPSGAIPNQIRDLINKGIIDDIKNAQYEFKQKCVDSENIERMASTLKVDLSFQKDPVRPTICLNLRKLAEQNADPSELSGLLFHEHARHFGYEDTDEDGFHPLVIWIANNFHAMDFATEADYRFDGFYATARQQVGHRKDVDGGRERKNTVTDFITTNDDVSDFSIVIDKTVGDCSGVQMGQYGQGIFQEARNANDEDFTLPFDQGRYNSPSIFDISHYPIPSYGQVKEGAVFKLEGKRLEDKPVFALAMAPTLKGRTKTFFGNPKLEYVDRQKCEVSYHFESSRGKSKSVTTFTEVNSYHGIGTAYPIARLRKFNAIRNNDENYNMNSVRYFFQE